MAAEIPVDSFLDLLRQSGLVSDSQMLSLMAEFSGESAAPQTARAVADELVKRNLLTDWQADNLLRGKHRGFFLGPHRILRPLGQGGMSRVFLAEHEMMRRRCAIKILPSKHQADPDLLNRFRLEAFAIAQLDHPHIVRAYDFNKDVKYGKDIDYLVMEYVEGQDLRRMVEEQGPLDYRKAADYICQAAEGLAHAHAVGLVHRDVKPANLLVDPNGVLKILDLGLARVTFEGEEAWQTAEGEQSAVGTADYVAPEQVMDSRSVDGRADIYSLGYTFYYLLTGRRPFPKSTLVELLMAHRVENPEPITNLRPDVPLELVEIIGQMTAKTPDLRFQSAKEVAEKLQAWLSDSASGREYSRISALMAAAMRAKQPGSEDVPPKADPIRDADLELAFLDDDATAPARADPPASHRPEPQKPVELKDNPRKLNPGDSGKTNALTRAQADLLLDAIPDQGRLAPVVLPQFKHHSDTHSLLGSPWLWVGLAAVVLVVLVILAIAIGLSSQKPEEPADEKAVAKKDDAHPADSPSPAPVPPTRGASSRPAEAPKSVAAPVAVPDKAEPVEQKPTQPPADKPTSPPEPVSPSPTDEQKTPPQPANPPAEKKLDTDKLLAGLTTIAVDFKSSDTDQKSKLNFVIAARAKEAVKNARLTLDEKSPNLMKINVKVSNSPELFTVVVSADLTCRDSSGATVSAWKQTKQFVSVDPRRGGPEQVLKQARPAASKFFEQFTDEVRRARAKSRSN